MVKEIRNFFETLINNKNKTVKQETYRIYNGYNSVFTTFGENFYENDQIRACIDTIARHCAKFEPRHYKIWEGNRDNIKGDINFLLSNKPNPIDTTYDFIYRIVTLYLIYNNSYVYIDKDSQGMITGFYPINYTTAEWMKDKQNNLYLKFQLFNGKTHILPYADLIHLRRFYSKNELWGTDNKALKEPVQIQHTAEEGIANAIKTSNALRGIITYTQNLKEKDIKASRDAFVKDFMQIESSSGIAAIDSKGEFKELNIEPITLDKDQLEHVDQRVLNYFGLNKAILSSDFTPDQWNAFYEAVLEPIAIYLGQVFTNQIFSKRAIKEGHKIEFTVNRVQYSSMDTKIKLIKELRPLGILSTDDSLDILDMPTIGGEEGNRRVQSLNYVNIDLVDTYQLGKSGSLSVLNETKNEDKKDKEDDEDEEKGKGD